MKLDAVTREYVASRNKQLALLNSLGTVTRLRWIPLTSSVGVRNTPDLTLHRCVSVWKTPPPAPSRTHVHVSSSSPWISVGLLICSIRRWMIRQVEVPLWNETHPFPLSAARCCNDSREVEKEEEEKEEEEAAEMPSGTSQLCRCLMLWTASPPGTVCFPGKDGEVGQFVWDARDDAWSAVHFWMHILMDKQKHVNVSAPKESLYILICNVIN